MDVTTRHRTEVRLTEAEWFVIRHPRDGMMQVRTMVATWSSTQLRPRLDLDGVHVRKDGSADLTRPMNALLLTWEPAAGPTVRQLPPLIRTVLEAVGMVLPD